MSRDSKNCKANEACTNDCVEMPWPAAMIALMEVGRAHELPVHAAQQTMMVDGSSYTADVNSADGEKVLTVTQIANDVRAGMIDDELRQLEGEYCRLERQISSIESGPSYPEDTPLGEARLRDLTERYERQAQIESRIAELKSSYPTREVTVWQFALDGSMRVQLSGCKKVG